MIKKKIAHLIVGFPIYSYFINAINSVLNNDSSSVIIVITTGKRKFFGWGGWSDWNLSDDIKIKNYLRVLERKYPNLIIVYKNIEQTPADYKFKTGSLYKAYNLALQISTKLKIDFLHIIQNDFQLMWWNKDFVRIVDEIYINNKNVVNISCRFFNSNSINKNEYEVQNIYFRSLNKKKSIYFNKNYSLSDHGFFNIKRINKLKIFFKGTESSLNKNLKKFNIIMAHFPIPFIAAVPWPAVVRKGFVEGQVLDSKHPFMSCIYRDPIKKILNANAMYKQEDLVKTNAWWALEPYWYTELGAIDYIKYLLKLKSQKLLNLQYTKYGHDKMNFFEFFFKKKFPSISFYLITFLFYKFRRIVKKIIKIV